MHYDVHDCSQRVIKVLKLTKRKTKVNKEEDDKMRTTAANVAARAAVGGDDMLSKWQLISEQARQKREGGVDASSGSQSGKDNRKSRTTPGNSRKDNKEGNKRGQVSGAPTKLGWNPVVAPQPEVICTISVKDLIAVLVRNLDSSKAEYLPAFDIHAKHLQVFWNRMPSPN